MRSPWASISEYWAFCYDFCRRWPEACTGEPPGMVGCCRSLGIDGCQGHLNQRFGFERCKLHVFLFRWATFRWCSFCGICGRIWTWWRTSSLGPVALDPCHRNRRLRLLTSLHHSSWRWTYLSWECSTNCLVAPSAIRCFARTGRACHIRWVLSYKSYMSISNHLRTPSYGYLFYSWTECDTRILKPSQQPKLGWYKAQVCWRQSANFHGCRLSLPQGQTRRWGFQGC